MVNSDWEENFRKNVRVAVEFRDTTFTELAQKAQAGRPGLSRLMNGDQKATIERAGRIAAALNIPLPRLLESPHDFQQWIRSRALSLAAG